MSILHFVIIFALLFAAIRLLLLRCRRGASGWEHFEHRRYAHRGLHNAADGVPENSLAAFRRAIRHGYGAELDVHLLRDGSLAVFHDSDLKRMTGTDGVLEDCTAQDLSSLHLAGTAETVPQFCEVLSLYESTGLPLVVELKPLRGNHNALTERAVRELDRFHVPYCMESFDPRCLRWLRKHRPDLLRGQLSADFLRDRSDRGLPMDFLAAKLLMNFYGLPDFLAYRFEDRAKAPLRFCRRVFGAHIFYWTVRSRAELDIAEREGAQAIFEGFDPNEK